VTPLNKRPLILPVAAAQQVSLRRRGDDFLIGQAVMWMGALTGLAEEGKVHRVLAAELLMKAAELTYALAALCK
jgi:hypothetical protein